MNEKMNNWDTKTVNSQSSSSQLNAVNQETVLKPNKRLSFNRSKKNLHNRCHPPMFTDLIGFSASRV